MEDFYVAARILIKDDIETYHGQRVAIIGTYARTHLFVSSSADKNSIEMSGLHSGDPEINHDRILNSLSDDQRQAADGGALTVQIRLCMDKTPVQLGSVLSSGIIRPIDEIEQFDGKKVIIIGRIMKRPPTISAAPPKRKHQHATSTSELLTSLLSMRPCIIDIERIEEYNVPDDAM